MQRARGVGDPGERTPLKEEEARTIKHTSIKVNPEHSPVQE